MAKEIKQDGSVVLTSKNAGFEFDPKCTSFQISGSCYMDRQNEPSCFNKTKRSAKKAWAALESAWNDNMTMSEGFDILVKNGVRMHWYCAVD